MDSLPSFMVYALTLSPILKYGFVTLVAMFEGPILFTVCGFFLRFGTEHPLPFFVALGNLLGDTFWYCLGYFFARKAIMARGSLLGIDCKHLEMSEKLFEQYQGRVLFFSKATLGFGTGLGIPALFTAAGMSKVPFGRYMAINIAGELLLLVAFMTVGYVFGISYQSVSKDLRVVALIAFAVLLVLGVFFANRALRKKRLALESDNA